MVWFLLLVMLTACAASCPETQDLYGEVLIFPEETATDYYKPDYYKPEPEVNTFTAATVCLRVKTDLCRDHSLFSVATSQEDNDFLIFWDQSKKAMRVYVHGHFVGFKDLNYTPNKFHSICVTWDSCTGVVKMWFDDCVTTTEYLAIGPIADACVILGQDQDTYCGGFSAEQSFVGEITDLHVWDYIIDVCEIENYINYELFCPGNAINWRQITAESNGKIVTGPKQICSQNFLEPFPQLCGRDGCSKIPFLYTVRDQRYYE